jgi:hypothetical protein
MTFGASSLAPGLPYSCTTHLSFCLRAFAPSFVLSSHHDAHSSARAHAFVCVDVSRLKWAPFDLSSVFPHCPVSPNNFPLFHAPPSLPRSMLHGTFYPPAPLYPPCHFLPCLYIWLLSSFLPSPPLLPSPASPTLGLPWCIHRQPNRNELDSE